MADTTFTPIPDDLWTEVGPDGTTGYMVNVASRTILFLEAAAQPAASFLKGIPLRPGEDVNFILTAGQKVWARGIPENKGNFPGDSEVAITLST